LETTHGASRDPRGFPHVALGQTGAIALGAIFWLAMAGVLHPRAYGHLGWLISIAMFVSTFCVLGLGKTVATYYPREKRGELLSGAVLVVLMTSLAAGGAIGMLLDPLVGLLVVGLSLFSIAVYSELGRRRYGNYMWMLLGVKLVSIFLAIAIYLWWGVVAGIVAGFAVSYLIFGCVGLGRVRTNPGIRRVGGKAGFAFRALGADVSNSSTSFLDKILIGHLFGMTALGFYYLAYRIFVALSVLPKVLLFYLLPEKSVGTRTRGIETFGVLTSIALAGLVFVLPPLIVPRVFPDFIESVGAIQLMGLAIIPATVAGIKMSELYSREGSNSVMISNTLALGTGVVGIMTLGKSFGVNGLAASMLLLQTVLAVSLVFSLKPPITKGATKRLAKGFVAMALASALLLAYVDSQARKIEIEDGGVRETINVMDTYATITIIEENVQKAIVALDAAFEEIRRIEKLMSAYDDESEVFALNVNGTDWTALSPDLMHVLEKAKHYSSITDGSFDVTVFPLVQLWMERTKKWGRLPTPDEVNEVLEFVGYEGLIIDENGNRARFVRPGMSITLGGIAKGYAVDRASEVLMSHGIESALVEIGGDIRAIGNKNGEPWVIALQNPRREDEFITRIKLDNQSIATSGDYVRYFFVDGRRIHHIIDPRTGYSADRCISVTIISENCIDADALSTAIFVMGPERGKELLDSLGVKGLIITSDKRVIVSDAWDHPLGF
jgi:thiamine biosynthesis lipoprotein